MVSYPSPRGKVEADDTSAGCDECQCDPTRDTTSIHTGGSDPQVQGGVMVVSITLVDRSLILAVLECDSYVDAHRRYLTLELAGPLSIPDHRALLIVLGHV